MPQIPLPAADPVTEPSRLLSRPWNLFLSRVLAAVQAAAATVQSLSRTVQGASIGATAIGPPLTDGLYRVSYVAHVTRAATSSSSLTVALAWTSGGVALTYTGAAITGNTTGAYQSASLPLVKVDEGTQPTFTTTYASSGATSMQYALEVNVERVR